MIIGGFKKATEKEQRNRRRAVAPIIATLLMVAIAVVGGILIFVFAQGFFNTTSDIAPGGTDALAVTGYDARDLATLKTHDGKSVSANNIANTEPDRALDDNDNPTTDSSDALLIYVRNKGTQTIEIAAIDVAGAAHTLDDTAGHLGGTIIQSTTAADNIPLAGRFNLVDTNDSTKTKTDSQINGGESATIIVRFDGDADIPTGRNIVVKITTANGGEFTLPVTIGERET